MKDNQYIFMKFSEYGKTHNMTEEQLVEFIKEKLNMPESEIRLMLAIERGEIDGDTFEVDEDEGNTTE